MRKRTVLKVLTVGAEQHMLDQSITRAVWPERWKCFQKIQQHLEEKQPPTHCCAARLFSKSSFNRNTRPLAWIPLHGAVGSWSGPTSTVIARLQKYFFWLGDWVTESHWRGACCLCKRCSSGFAGRAEVFYKFFIVRKSHGSPSKTGVFNLF